MNTFVKKIINVSLVIITIIFMIVTSIIFKTDESMPAYLYVSLVSIILSIVLLIYVCFENFLNIKFLDKVYILKYVIFGIIFSSMLFSITLLILYINMMNKHFEFDVKILFYLVSIVSIGTWFVMNLLDDVKLKDDDFVIEKKKVGIFSISVLLLGAIIALIIFINKGYADYIGYYFTAIIILEVICLALLYLSLFYKKANKTLLKILYYSFASTILYLPIIYYYMMKQMNVVIYVTMGISILFLVEVGIDIFMNVKKINE